MPRFPMITHLLTMLACGCLLVVPALGETYKWTDAEGKVHYSDQPPPPNVKQPIKVKPRAPTAPTAVPEAAGTPVAAPKSVAEQDAEFNRRRVEAAEREAAEKKAANEAAEKKKNCEQARIQLAGLQNGGRMTSFDEKGERTYLSDADVAQEIVRAQKAADSWCK